MSVSEPQRHPMQERAIGKMREASALLAEAAGLLSNVPRVRDYKLSDYDVPSLVQDLAVQVDRTATVIVALPGFSNSVEALAYNGIKIHDHS